MLHFLDVFGPYHVDECFRSVVTLRCYLLLRMCVLVTSSTILLLLSPGLVARTKVP